jgi:hypothetical protein
MKWVNFLWSFVTISFIAFLLEVLAAHSTSKLESVAANVFVIWIAVSTISLIVLALRLSRVFKGNSSFWYIFIGTSNFFLGIAVGIYILSGKAMPQDYLLGLIIGFNIFTAIYIFIDVLAKAIPGTKDHYQ